VARFVITGLSRLAVRVARELQQLGSEVTVVVEEDDDRHLATVIDRVATVVRGDGDRPAALEAARTRGADALLAVGDDDLDNLRTVACAAALDADVPVVLRSFDAAVADQLELAPNVRRAFSVSGLAAPAFVAAAAGDHTVQTLRLGADEIPLLRARIRAGGPLDGCTPDAIRRERDVVVVAHTGPDGGWVATTDTCPPLRGGDDVLIGGRLVPTLATALANDPLPDGPPASPASGRVRLLDGEDATDDGRRERVSGTLLPWAAVVLVALLLAGTIIFGVFGREDRNPLEALYFTVTVAWGDPGAAGEGAWAQLFALLLMVSVGALVGILFSYLAAVATEERMASRMHKQAARLHGHVVVAGLGTVGYRVVRLLRQLGVDAVALEMDAANRFASAGTAHVPVIIGDARLPEELARVGIGRAAVLLATTDDDLVNITACLQARSLNPGIRTVARIFDETLGLSAGPSLGIDAVVSASRLAAPAFVGAALDDHAPRRIHLGDLHLVAARHTFPDGLPGPEVRARWAADGIQVLLTTTDTAILCGPADAPALVDLLST
jgi:Trk K+ transport system NAD-binding subunit